MSTVQKLTLKCDGRFAGAWGREAELQWTAVKDVTTGGGTGREVVIPITAIKFVKGRHRRRDDIQ
jgi:hypothetical protein